MIKFFLSFISSLAVCLFVIKFASSFFQDPTDRGPQKFHVKPTPRAGGVGIFVGFVIVGLFISIQKFGFAKEYWLVVLSSIFAFSGGLIEDITKSVKPNIRLMFAILSALLGIYLLNATIPRVNIPFIDKLFTYKVFAAAFTIFAVAGVINSINIIDGFNGLAGMVSAIILLALGYVSFKLGDTLLFSVCLSLTGAVLGFLAWNYPSGFIFLGDGGAYFIGFIIAEVSILLINRHPRISAWFPLLLLAYPVTETLFSIYRRKFLKGTSPTAPDGEHFHTLVFKRISKFLVHGYSDENRLKRNYITAPYLWLLTVLTAIPAILFRENTILLMVSMLLFVLFYIWLYWRIVRFKTPGIFKSKFR